MHNIIEKVTVVILLTINSLVYAEAKEAVKNPALLGKVETENFTNILPIHWAGGLPLVDVEIDGKKYRFLFDTAAPTTVPPALIGKLNILEKNIDLHDSAGKKRVAKLYTLPSIKVGGVEFKDFAVLTQDFSKLFPLSCLGFDGILGYNILRDLSVKLSLADNEITISDKPIEHKKYIEIPINFTVNSGPRIVLVFPFGDGVFEIDTGKNEGIGLGDTSTIALLEKEKYPSRAVTGTFFSSMNGAAKNTKAFEYVVKDFSIAGKLKIKSFPFTVDDSHAFLIGNTFLKHFSIVLDFPSKKAYFRPENSTGLSESFKETFGMIPSWSSDKGLFISAITENTPASKSSLKLGDIILKLNDINTSIMKKEEFCDFLLNAQDENRSFEKKDILILTVKHDDDNISMIRLKK